jgi:hypothetical protein
MIPSGFDTEQIQKQTGIAAALVSHYLELRVEDDCARLSIIA